MKTLEDAKYRIMHKDGCGKVAMLFVGDELPKAGDFFLAGDYLKVSGEPYMPHEKIHCSSCGNLFQPRTDFFEENTA